MTMVRSREDLGLDTCQLSAGRRGALTDAVAFCLLRSSLGPCVSSAPTIAAPTPNSPDIRIVLISATV